MIRKLILSAVAVVAMTLGAFAPGAHAQDDATPTPTPPVCTEVGYNGCLAYPAGGFGSSAPTAVPTPTPQPTSAAVVSADTVDATAGATGSGAASIAFTGAESRVLGYAGAGLIAFGAVALVAARRRTESELN